MSWALTRTILSSTGNASPKKIHLSPSQPAAEEIDKVIGKGKTSSNRAENYQGEKMGLQKELHDFV